MDYKQAVKAGYNAIARQYLETWMKKSANVQPLEEFAQKLPAEASVLDTGCGAGLPIAKILSERFQVTGVDFSETQIELAEQNIPNATFLCQDMTQLDFPAKSFDGICSFYAIIHISHQEHRALLENFQRILKPSGAALLCLDIEDLKDDVEEDFHGKHMYESQFDAETYESMLKEIGFRLIWSKLIVDETYGDRHLSVFVKN